MMETKIGRYSDKIFDHKIVALIPAYNEERHIGSVVLMTRIQIDTIIVVDDGSCDATADIARAAGAIVVCLEKNMGKGAALCAGFLKASELDVDVLVCIDGDGQHLPEELGRVIEPICMGEADLVIGSRYLEATSNVPRHRIWGHILFNWITRWSSGTGSSDSQSGFRAFSRAAVDLISFQSEGFSVESEMQFLASEHNLRVKEVPITIRYDDKPKRPVVRHGFMVLNGILRLIGQYRPLLFFGVSGFLVMLFGAAWGLGVVGIYGETQNLAVGYALISVFLVIIGGISLSTGIILHSMRGLLLDLVGRNRQRL